MSYTFTDGDYRVYIKSNFGRGGLSTNYSKSNVIPFSKTLDGYYHKQKFFAIPRSLYGGIITDTFQMSVGEEAPVIAIEYPNPYDYLDIQLIPDLNPDNAIFLSKEEPMLPYIYGTRVGEGIVSIVGDDDTKLHVYVCPANGIYYNGMRQDQNNNYYFTFTNDIGDNFYPRSIECITPFHSEDIDTYSVISSNSSIIEVVNSYIWVGRVHIILSVVGIGEATITTNITLNNGNQYSLSAIARPQTGLEFGYVNYYRF